MIDILGGKCSICKISNPIVLEFNHIDPTKKIKDNGKYFTTICGRLQNYPKEIKNLELLCANCHRIKTWKWHEQKKLKVESFVNAPVNKLKQQM